MCVGCVCVCVCNICLSLISSRIIVHYRLFSKSYYGDISDKLEDDGKRSWNIRSTSRGITQKNGSGKW